MRRVRNLWFSVFAMLALASAIGAGTAAAETEYAPTGLPEFGRCVKVTEGTGGYKYANCIAHSKTHTGSYEWKPGPGETKPTFEATLNKFKLETAKHSIQCGGFVTGTYADTKHATVELELKGCGIVGSNPIVKCQSGPEEGEINAPPGGIEAEIGFIKGGEKPVVGWDIKPKEPSTEVLGFFCGSVEEIEKGKLPEQKWTVEGSAIGSLKKINKMTSVFLLTYSETGGVQQIEKFEGGVPDTLKAEIFLNPGFPTPPETVKEGAGLLTRGERVPFEIENGEPFEIKGKFK